MKKFNDLNFRIATNDEKETATIMLIEQGVTESDLRNVLVASYNGDDELLQSSLAWIFNAIEAVGIEDGNVNAIVKYFEYNV